MSLNPLVQADATSLESAQANVLASSIAQCALLNNNLKSIYLTAFNNWKISVDAGRIDNKSYPKPPKSFVVVKDQVSGFSFPEQVGPAVCEVPPIPEDRFTPRGPSEAELAQREYLKNVRPMNTAQGETPDAPPIGTIVTDPADNTRWEKKLAGVTPFGRAVAWFRIG
jgi:hypothetical protein